MDFVNLWSGGLRVLGAGQEEMRVLERERELGRELELYRDQEVREACKDTLVWSEVL
jgi:hypothetical protein